MAKLPGEQIGKNSTGGEAEASGEICLRFFVAPEDYRDIGGKTYKVREETTAIAEITPLL
jgi:hypothetical protein